MGPWPDGSTEARHLLVWLIVAAAAFDFGLQAVFAFRIPDVFEGIGWVFGAVAIATLAYFIESLKVAVEE